MHGTMNIILRYLSRATTPVRKRKDAQLE